MMEKSDVVVKLRQIANDLLMIADSFDEKKKPISLEEVRKFLADLSRNGKTSEVRQLLLKHGASKLTEIDPDKYEALLDDARKIENGS